MTKLFPTRSRHELKLKFKREEKANLRLVDRAMIEKVDFDFNTLQEDFRKLCLLLLDYNLAYQNVFFLMEY